MSDADRSAVHLINRRPNNGLGDITAAPKEDTDEDR